MTAYTDAVARRNKLRDDRAELTKAYEKAAAHLDRNIDYQQQVIGLAEAGGPAEAFIIARGVLSVRWARAQVFDRGHWQETGPRRTSADVYRQIDRAIEDLRAGCPAMKREYFGIKAYDQWPSQASDHPYGYGPTHGSIWFEIGLKTPTVDLTEEQTIACIQWLRALRENPEFLP